MKNYIILLSLLFITNVVFSQFDDKKLLALKENVIPFSGFDDKSKNIDFDLASIDQMDSLWVSNTITKNQNIFSNYEDFKVAIDSMDKNPNLRNYKHEINELNELKVIKIEYNERLSKYLNYAISKKIFYRKVLELKHYYFPMIEHYLELYDLPLELKYMTVIESGLNAKAVSKVGAKGLWQFMYLTGKQYGLKINNYIDERFDPVKSTIAACKYLKDLHNMFGDWGLAIAAYNGGLTRVTRAMRRVNGKAGFWEIQKYLPKETGNYFPFFISTMYLMEEFEKYGIDYQKNTVHFLETDTIHLRKAVNYKKLKEITGVEIDKLKFLNPSFKKGLVVKNSDEKYVLRLPVNKIGVFIEHEEKLYKKQYASQTNTAKSKSPKTLEEVYYEVKSGDSLWKISKKFPTISVNDIIKINNIANSNMLYPGMKLRVFR